ncbi:alpha/beta fold hydrolase [Aliiroseovarius sp. Z3]|uniref:alpha/beta fold hydrolase n=1 Tax=Aliiroseovarius sp. Z3 TaxID=2811402 RepID=UPI0023B2F620|nr:alpha/beta hydrolase [Aliiroseovarius sp. Z3]MDE9449961.1 alpha/beta fold hydrolase [Aliiroseovarius sp. Z3]
MAAVDMLDGNPAASTPPYTLFDMRDDVLRCVNALEIEHFALLGFSMGGMIAQLVAAETGDRVTGLIQICSSGGEATLPTSNSGWTRILRTAQPFKSEQALLEWLAEGLTWNGWSHKKYQSAIGPEPLSIG